MSQTRFPPDSFDVQAAFKDIPEQDLPRGLHYNIEPTGSAVACDVRVFEDDADEDTYGVLRMEAIPGKQEEFGVMKDGKTTFEMMQRIDQNSSPDHPYIIFTKHAGEFNTLGII